MQYGQHIVNVNKFISQIVFVIFLEKHLLVYFLSHLSKPFGVLVKQLFEIVVRLLEQGFVKKARYLVLEADHVPVVFDTCRHAIERDVACAQFLELGPDELDVQPRPSFENLLIGFFRVQRLRFRQLLERGDALVVLLNLLQSVDNYVLSNAILLFLDYFLVRSLAARQALLHEPQPAEQREAAR